MIVRQSAASIKQIELGSFIECFGIIKNEFNRGIYFSIESVDSGNFFVRKFFADFLSSLRS
ncbi:hypothetical protein DLM78_11005 [Leptospira stimsonii]|uniref:Uncharacterized protein n=1 Tax=Leptospira stimsonii TaxID=2202203 RepID=A0A8B6RYK3_9LEPT|nr:hypothetical protein DLM78_11005 [Leptospira stimsonii]